MTPTEALARALEMTGSWVTAVMREQDALHIIQHLAALGYGVRPIQAAEAVVLMEGGDLGALLARAVSTIESFPRGTKLWAHFDHGRIKLVGPWRFQDGIKWQALAEPYNATGIGLDREIEGNGGTPQEAVLALLLEIKEVEKNNE